MKSVAKQFSSLAIIFCILWPLLVNGQDLHYNHQIISVEDGLASREVLCGLQDKRGFLWFGTRNGLNRFDGKQFTLMTKRDGLQGNRIINLAEDSEGKIWISYGDGGGNYTPVGKTDIYDPISGELIPIEKKFPELPFDEKDIYWILSNQQGEIYFVIRKSASKLYRYNVNTGFEFIIEKGEKSTDLIVDIFYKPNANGENIALNHKSTFYGKQFTSYNEHETKISYFNKSGQLEYVSLDEKSNSPRLKIEKHIPNEAPVIAYVPCDSLTFETFKVLDDFEGRMNDPYTSAVVFPSKSGLLLFKDYQFVRLIPDVEGSKGMSLNLALFSDRQDNLWVCSPDGIHKFSPVENRFKVFFDRTQFNSKDRLGNQIRGIFADTTGNILTGGEFGTAYYDRKAQSYQAKYNGYEFMFYDSDKRKETTFLFGSGVASMEFPNGEIAIKYSDKAVNQTGQQSAFIGHIWATYPLSEERYLLGNHYAQFLVWDVRQNKFKELDSCGVAIPKPIFPNQFIYKIIFSSKDQHYWAVGSSGCYRISKDLCITDYYAADNIVDELHRLPVNDLRDIYEDQDGIFWLASNGEGLLRWDRERRAIQSYTIQDGMPSNIMYCILPDDYGNLWISTDNGLVRFNKSTQYINVFSTKEGIAHNEFNRISSFKAEDGRMYFGGIDGLTTFHPKDFETDKSAEQIPLVVTGLFQFLGSKNQLVNLTPELNTNQEIVMRPGDKFFRLEFALLDFRFPVNNYRYQIEGLDREWQYTSEPLLRISGLPYGNYNIRIAGQSFSGAWSKQELIIPIHVIRPYYIRWWAFIIYGMGFLAFLYFFRQNQVNRVLQKSENLRLQELDSLKTKLYTNITHEFRTPLTVIIGMAGQLVEDPSQELPLQTGSVSGIQEKSNLILRNARSLLRLINQMLDLSKLDNEKLKINWVNGDIILFLRYLSESYHSYADSRDIQFRYGSSVESLEMDYDQEKMVHIISNLISNAFKFTPEGGIINFQVSWFKEESMLQIIISDSGIGIVKENLRFIFDRFYQIDGSHTRKGEGTGIGLAYTKELVELLGGSIIAKSEIGQGAEFRVLLPIHSKSNVKADFNQLTFERPAFDRQSDLTTSLIDEESPVSEETPLVLIVEDNADVATYIQSCLTDLYRVQWAKNGQLGIDMALDLIPDIIISDIMMPEKDGYEVTQFLKNDERTSHIPIILLTGKADMDSKIIGLERGADVYLSKPFDKQELLVRIKNLIVLRKRLQKRYTGQAAFDPKNGDEHEIEPALEKGFQIEDAFLGKVNTVIENHLSDATFTVPKLCRELNMSQSQLYRKLKALTDQSITAYLRRYRLHQGRILLESTTLNVSEVAYEVGFSDPLYFSRMFSEEYGIPPTESRK